MSEDSIFLGFGYASALPKYRLTAAERKALKARKPIGFVHFPLKKPVVGRPLRRKAT